MKNKTKALTGIFASGALVAAGAYWYQGQQTADAPAVVADATKLETKIAPKAQSVMGNVSVFKQEDTRKVRDSNLLKRNASLRPRESP